MPGERFSRLYLQPGEPAQDSGRARHRVGALFGESVVNERAEQLAAHLGRELGVPVPGGGRHLSEWHAFFRECRTPVFLDAITIVYRYLFWHVGAEVASWWRDVVCQIFAEENLAYEIDEAGGVHPRVDREFQRNLASVIAGLQSPRYHNVREHVENASRHLSADPPNHKQAWRAMLSALEALFGLMFPYVRLSADEIEPRLRPVIERAYPDDATAQRVALRMLSGLKEWVAAAHDYRHQPGAAEPAQPPADVAILAISWGASLLRWLAGLDEDPSA
jgi:hypothetical protein